MDRDDFEVLKDIRHALQGINSALWWIVIVLWIVAWSLS